MKHGVLSAFDEHLQFDIQVCFNFCPEKKELISDYE